jgi:hypothetical protein
MPMSCGKGADTLETGVEVYVSSARETVDELGIEGIDPKLSSEISLRWDGDMEGACAEALAAAIATLTPGVIWDDSQGAIISVVTAAKYCHQLSTAE